MASEGTASSVRSEFGALAGGGAHQIESGVSVGALAQVREALNRRAARERRAPSRRWREGPRSSRSARD